jgi:hypothetical protein
MPTATKRRVTLAEREMTSLLVRYDIEPTPGNVATLTAYVRRTHRAHWLGVIGALAAGALGWLGSTGVKGAGWGLARILIGYLIGASLEEVFWPQRRAEGPVHTASLVTRDPDHLSPRWGRWLPWAALVPCLFAPLLLLGDHPTHVYQAHLHHRRSEFITSGWSAAPLLVTTALIAAAGLVLWRLSLHRLSRRRLPADQPGAARLDLLTRALSARSIAGTAASLGLVLLGGLASLGQTLMYSRSCTPSGGCDVVYAEHPYAHHIQDLGLLIVVALFLFLFSRIRRRVDPALLGPVSPPVTDPVTGPVP